MAIPEMYPGVTGATLPQPDPTRQAMSIADILAGLQQMGVLSGPARGMGGYEPPVQQPDPFSITPEVPQPMPGYLDPRAGQFSPVGRLPGTDLMENDFARWIAEQASAGLQAQPQPTAAQPTGQGGGGMINDWASGVAARASQPIPEGGVVSMLPQLIQQNPWLRAIMPALEGQWPGGTANLASVVPGGSGMMEAVGMDPNALSVTVPPIRLLDPTADAQAQIAAGAGAGGGAPAGAGAGAPAATGGGGAGGGGGVVEPRLNTDLVAPIPMPAAARPGPSTGAPSRNAAMTMPPPPAVPDAIATAMSQYANPGFTTDLNAGPLPQPVAAAAPVPAGREQAAGARFNATEGGGRTRRFNAQSKDKKSGTNRFEDAPETVNNAALRKAGADRIAERRRKKKSGGVGNQRRN